MSRTCMWCSEIGDLISNWGRAAVSATKSAATPSPGHAVPIPQRHQPVAQFVSLDLAKLSARNVGDDKNRLGAAARAYPEFVCGGDELAHRRHREVFVRHHRDP